MYREHPILFSTPMVQAILEGKKNQTRRIVKAGFSGVEEMKYVKMDLFKDPKIGLQAFFEDGNIGLLGVKYRYGYPGDTLWVREAWNHAGDTGKYFFKAGCNWHLREYENVPDVNNFQFKPSIHMPKEACRLRLKTVGVKVERVQDISEEDAKSEGAPCGIYREGPNVEKAGFQLELNNHASYRDGFRFLWQTLHGRDSWDANPYVWAISWL